VKSESISTKVQRANALIKRKYGITLSDYDKMLEKQNGQCAICGTRKVPNCGRFVVDHDHSSGKIRGLLCSNCNTGLGLLGDDPQTLESALTYLRKHT
jgi:hypothetical protein